MYYKMIVCENRKQLLNYFNKYLEGTQKIKTDLNKEKYRLVITSLEEGYGRTSIFNMPLKTIIFIPDNYFDGNYEKYMDKKSAFLNQIYDETNENTLIL